MLTTPLINGPNGVQKMSASLDNYIGIADPPAEMYGKAMSSVDELMPQYYELLLDADRRRRTTRTRPSGSSPAGWWSAGTGRSGRSRRGRLRPHVQGQAGDRRCAGDRAAGRRPGARARAAGGQPAGGVARRGAAADRPGRVRLDGTAAAADELDVGRDRLAGAELRVGRRFARIEAA